jgi:hypothetical protein
MWKQVGVPCVHAISAIRYQSNPSAVDFFTEVYFYPYSFTVQWKSTFATDGLVGDIPSTTEEDDYFIQHESSTVSLITETRANDIGRSSKRMPSTGESSGKGRCFPISRTICTVCGVNVSKLTRHGFSACAKNRRKRPELAVNLQPQPARVLLEISNSTGNSTRMEIPRPFYLTDDLLAEASKPSVGLQCEASVPCDEIDHNGNNDISSSGCATEIDQPENSIDDFLLDNTSEYAIVNPINSNDFCSTNVVEAASSKPVSMRTPNEPKLAKKPRVSKLHEAAKITKSIKSFFTQHK